MSRGEENDDVEDDDVEENPSVWTRRSRKALGDLTRAALYGHLKAKCRGPAVDQEPDTHFVRACRVEIHVNMSQEPFYAETYRKSAAPGVSTLIKHRPLH